MSAQHTPGPWMVKSWPLETGAIGYYVARNSNGTGTVLDWMKGDDGKVVCFASLRKARAAIAKATGAAS